MKSIVAACVLLITLQLRLTGSTAEGNPPSQDGELCSELKEFLQAKDEALKRAMKSLLEALFEAFCNKDLAKTSTSTTLMSKPVPPEEKDLAKTATSTTLTSAPVPPEEKDLAKTATSTTLTSAPVPPAPENAAPNDSKGKDEPQASPKSDRKFLWIVLGVLGVLMLVTVLILKSKVLICTKTYTNAGVADNMEEKMYSTNDDIVLLGVTPGAEGEDNWCFSPKGSPGYEDISPRSTC